MKGTKQQRIAIIPARGGSKRLPRKNIMDFRGKPMIAWTIEAAREAKAFDRVIVSTEDAEVAAVSRTCGAEVPFLRLSHFDDKAPVSLATIAALDQAQEAFGQDYDIVVQLMANCPLRNAADITDALTAFENTDAEFQLSCVRFGQPNPWWAMRLDKEGRNEWLFPEAITSRSQDLQPLYAPTGAIWVARAAALTAAGTFYGPNHRFRAISWISALDIDDEDDLVLAHAAYLIKSQGAGV